MPKGFATAREAFAEIEARKNAGGSGGSFFKVADGEFAVVRFIEDEPQWAWVHDLDDGSYSADVCLDQDLETGQRNGEACPGCDREAASAEQKGWKDRKFRRHMAGVIPIIWRDGPVFEEVEDEQGNKRKNFENVVGAADQVSKWTFGKMILEELDGLSVTYKGLTSRDFKIARKGTKLNTKYNIDPVVDDKGNTSSTPLSKADNKLIEDAPDLTGYYRKSEYDSWGEKGSKRKQSGATSAPATADVQPFKKRQAVEA